MAGSRATRQRVFEAIEASDGTEVASDLLELMPPAGLPELATKQDLAVLKAEILTATHQEFASVRAELGGVREEIMTETRQEFASIRAELGGFRDETRQEFASVRAELSGLRDETRGEFASVRTELASVRGEFATIRQEMRADQALLTEAFQRALNQQTNRYIKWMFAAMGVAVAVPTAVWPVVAALS